jgi:hypothetical protein
LEDLLDTKQDPISFKEQILNICDIAEQKADGLSFSGYDLEFSKQDQEKFSKL